MAHHQEDSIIANWKCLVACFLIAMGPFQYGVDFGLIAGMENSLLLNRLTTDIIAGIQAMVGFNEVSSAVASSSRVGTTAETSLRSSDTKMKCRRQAGICSLSGSSSLVP